MSKTRDHKVKASLEECVEELGIVLKTFIQTRQAVLDAALGSMAANLRSGGKILVIGNGGSAAEAQHFAAELINGIRERGRRPNAALALTTDTSSLTAIANDRSFEEIFSRQIEALGRPGDILVAMTTSGSSPDILRGLETARDKGLGTVVLTGQAASGVAPLADYLLDVPSCSVPRIQETHLVILHILAEGLEAEQG